ncbi:16S rRNA (uracil(1498)-N(3))-methyltransferase [Salinibacterium sp. NSLL150]|uniref:16S rRNA (uracil(1498)-N(3))-methyltransferase n=1 Tax=unclassified Salinibacterium TaxID=2632331 RepID=UPI0018CDBE29|nr:MULTISPECIES: 16S rRNA (uracil(1498)-N(3))-methyltransferase [unclassified Salinibacterium]MBH0098913.1 16S rRNA (uracil(1498)-N(3))-methyltransferase [Salinibacterium sp. NSLL35]MBH0101668.1 16S rRNA (uracil(1498)-N(3))-methyltransferase [Salinibacterium sp. NSLL150]MBH0104427.1 16S rRNA (uracil(1498)-N(3))-methyltransferase [Salinibacterium sp. NSLL16]MBH0107188.1 16S rRNA (uracil(1498)-N(3))-methyltransferase [Salinibacterium sp. NSLL17]
MAHLYIDEELGDTSVGDTVSLGNAEARHAVTVSRLKVGEVIAISNGAGLVVSGPVVTAEHTQLTIEVAEVQQSPRRTPAVFLAQALAKADRDELAVQVATELGVDGVIPWSAARSISRWQGPKVAKGRDRWAAIVREASKQSLRTWLPDVLDLVTTKQLAAFASTTRMLVLEPTATETLADLDVDDRDIVLVVGPEGGVADHELALLAAAGASTIRLGSEVLRTSTAGPAALAALNVKLGRWS